MPIPHLVFKQLAKRRLLGKEGKEREREIRKLLAEMPGYKTGPFGEIRKWLSDQIQESHKRRSVKAKTFFDVKKEGEAQIVLLGPPNIGKSSLLKKLSSIQIKVADYAFTTLKPIPTIVDFGGALVQIVEIPGLIQGASEGKGGGKALLAAARNANYLVLVTSVDVPIAKAMDIYQEMRQGQLPEPKFMICNKMDKPEAAEKIAEVRRQFPDLEVIPVSTASEEGLEQLKQKLWQELHLIRVFLKDKSGTIAPRPVVVQENATVRMVMDDLPSSTSEHFHFAKIWGESAKFAGQQVGSGHVLSDGDIIQLH
jgi:small GTP-binding protein